MGMGEAARGATAVSLARGNRAAPGAEAGQRAPEPAGSNAAQRRLPLVPTGPIGRFWADAERRAA